YSLSFRVDCPLFFSIDTATTEISTLSLHDALPISPAAGGAPRPPGLPAPRPRALPPPGRRDGGVAGAGGGALRPAPDRAGRGGRDRKSTRLNSSHVKISYAVFCLKKKKKKQTPHAQ